MKKKLIVLTGAGISAESGIQTFRDDNGLWENHRIEDVATPSAWNKDKKLVLDFYNARRKKLNEVEPNEAHKALVELEEFFNTVVITQNVDDLHERAGSTNVMHLHGELKKVRSTKDPSLVYKCEDEITIGDTCESGYQLRPHVVWFGEAVPMLEHAVEEIKEADIVLIIGTSMQVYPAAALVGYAPDKTDVYYIDPAPNINYELKNSMNLNVIESKATTGMEIFKQKIKPDQK